MRTSFFAALAGVVLVSHLAFAQSEGLESDSDPTAAAAQAEAPPIEEWGPKPIAYDSIGCSAQGVAMSSTEDLVYTMETSLWTFRSEKWNGYIDFRENGKYWTQWGFGQWEVESDGKIFMANEYNKSTFDVSVTADGRHFDGRRDDGLQISGDLICGKYTGPSKEELAGLMGPKGAIKKYFRELLGHDPDEDGMEYYYGLYLGGTSLEEIKQLLLSSPEYQERTGAVE